MFKIHSSICAALAAICLIPSLVSAQQDGKGRRGFDAVRVLQQLDTDKSGKLEPSEFSDRTRRFVERLGFDPSRPIDLKSIQSKINRDRQEADQEKKSASIVRKVPGFGEQANLPKVRGFSVDSEVSVPANNSWKSKNDPEIISQVERTLRRYDRNKDGVLDEVETKRARWSSPSPKLNDTNKDGKLSGSELAVRYAQRRQSESRQGRDSSRTSSGNRSKPSRAATPRSGFRGSSAASGSTSAKPAGETAKIDASTARKYQRYVDGLLRKYDKNGDNKISKSEQKDSNYALPGADSNKDGDLDREEVLNFYLHRSGSSEKSSSSGDKKSSTEKSEGEHRDSPSEEKSEKRVSSKFADKDRNGDGQIQMHEFATSWTNDLVDEFNAIDSNGDGVIVPEEWK